MRPRLLHLFLPMIILLAGCGAPEPDSDPAEPSNEERAIELIDALYETHGSNLVRNSIISFDFRESHYRAERKGWNFVYTRTYSDQRGDIVEVYSNDEISRRINNEYMDLTDRDRSIVKEDLNSVIYFALLPYSLKDPGVIPRYLGETTVEGQPYEMIEVTFTPDQGGEDWEDRFVYWIHPQNRTMDYFAYRYYTSGGGSRFRKAFNIREVNGIRFADYQNYSHPNILDELELFGPTVGSGELELFSEILIDNLSVELPMDNVESSD